MTSKLKVKNDLMSHKVKKMTIYEKKSDQKSSFKNRLLITNSNKNCVCYDKVLFIEKMN